MSFLKRIFFKKKEEDFETVLATLVKDIEKRQIKLSEIRLREKRSTLLATIYTLLVWVIYTTLWYLNGLPSIVQPTAGGSRHGGGGIAERALRGIPVFVGPIIILFIRRIVQVWYTRKADAEEKTLQILMKQRRTKVEEIKKKTNFESMVKLFQEYDEFPARAPTAVAATAAPLLRNRLVVKQQTPITPQRRTTPSSSTLQAQLTPVPSPFPMAPPRKRWYDKVADALLGDDDEDRDIGSPSSRYALICDKCFTHNGLVKESMWEDAQFICRNPSCHHFNRSVRSKRESLSVGSSPQSNSNSPTSVGALPHSSSPSSPSSHQQQQQQQPRPSRHSPQVTPSSERTSPVPGPSPAHDSDPDAPTVDFIDGGQDGS